MVELAEFEDLPEGCIANVISFTTPRDACILSTVSSTFRSAAQSDVVWERFLPSDYRSIISQSSLSLSASSSSKKDLYLHLCQNPLLIQNGNKSFLLEKLYGKKCYMLSPRSLSIVWGDTPRYWRWISIPESRFSEVAELVSVCWLEIKGWIKTCMLTPETFYGAYLVFKQSGGSGFYGFEDQPIEVSIGISGECDARQRTVYFEEETPRRPPCQIVPRRVGIFNRFRSRLVGSLGAQAQSSPIPEPPQHLDDSRYPKKRSDGWWEVELGEFFNKGDEDKEVEIGVYEVKSGDWKGGLVLQGIELKPKPKNNKQLTN